MGSEMCIRDRVYEVKSHNSLFFLLVLHLLSVKLSFYQMYFMQCLTVQSRLLLTFSVCLSLFLFGFFVSVLCLLEGGWEGGG